LRGAGSEPPPIGASSIVMWQVRLRMRATRPRARGRQRFIVGPSSAYAAATKSSSPTRPWLASAFATAERSTFSMSFATARWVNASTVLASGTLRPRRCSVTSRALRADERTHLARARTTCCCCSAVAMS
jgi:hypothetical protein